jgi:hypothetical protein
MSEAIQLRDGDWYWTIPQAIDTHLSAHSRHVLPKLRDLSLCVTEYQRTLDEGWNMCVREMQTQQAAQHEDEAVAEIEYIDDDGVTVKWLSNVVEGQKLYANPHPRMELTAERIMRIYDEQIAKGGSADNVIINTVRAALSRKGHE